ncbi:hypothetical protein A3L09_04585 [Thermococcus profundus]|uniref:SSD domain-containing protein n=1 Tax=Thermococcus profundus TaxID=49899 RepID=A0A2Z2MD94_THEPR|nr:MMPL family transporter [Thermococcus profundus]ASJ02585.1 hypothetical protein A3L09_04585 [Thermococcus profundus]
MAWNEWIVKHAKAIVAVWIIAVLLSIPLASRLHDVTNYSMDQFLPNDVESVKVQHTLEREFPSFSQSTNQTYMIVTGIDVNDPRAREAYERLKGKAETYGSNFTSYYDAVDLLRNKSDEVALNVTLIAANLTSSLYNTTVEMNETYGTILRNMSDLAASISDTKEAIQETAKVYLELRENLTEAYGKMIELQNAINQTSGAYVELSYNLTQLQAQMIELSSALNQTAQVYSELMENLTLLYGKMANLSTAINSTDAAYVVLHENLSRTSETLKALNATIWEINRGLYALNETYGRAYAGTVGVYRALTTAGVYSSGSLDPTTAEAVANATGTSVEFVYAVFNATSQIYSHYGSAGVTDGALANVTSGIVLSTLSDPGERKLAEAYAYAFYLAVEGFDRTHGSPYAVQELPEDLLPRVSSQLATAALENTPEVIAASGESMTVPGFGEINSETLSLLVNVSISLGPNPTPKAVEEETAEFAMEYLSKTQPDSPLLKLPDPKAVLTGLLRKGPTKDLERTLLEEGLMEEVGNEAKSIAPIVVNATMTYDPNAEGILTSNGALLENATIEATAAILKEENVPTDKSLLREVYESGGDEARISEVAKAVLRKAVAEELAEKGTENPEGMAGIIVDTAASNPGISTSAEELEDATIEIIKGILTQRGVFLNEKYLRELYEGKNPETVTREVLAEEVSKRLEGKVKDPAKLANVIVNVAEGIAKNETSLEEATIEAAEKAFAEEGVVIDEKYLREIYESGGDAEKLERVTREILLSGLIEKLEEKGIGDSEKTAEEILNAALSNPQGLARGEGIENATVEVVVSLAGNVDLPGNWTIEEVVERLYEGSSPGEIARALFLEGVEEEMKERNLPKDVKGKVIEIAESVASEYPIDESRTEALVREKALEIISENLKDNPVTEDLDAGLVIDISMKHLDDPDSITEDEVKPLSDDLYSKLYENARDYIEMLKSKDNRTMLILFTPKGGEGISDLEKASKAQYESSLKVKELALKEFGKDFKEVEAYVTGTPIQTYEAIKYGKEDNDKTTKFSVAGALLVLLILMGVALLATLLPFTGVATSTLTALGMLYLLARGDILDVGSWAQMLTVTTALGLGIDYSTYYLHRFKEYLAEGYDHDGAASEALKRAKDAVLASASTDIIAFASFVLAWEFPIFKTMGVIAPLAVIIVLLASLTFIPAITVLIGDKPIFWWPRHIEHHIGNVDLHERSRIAEWAVKHAKVVTIIALLIAVPAAYNFTNFHGTHDVKLFIPKDSETYHFLDLSDKTVGAGVSSPTYVVLDLGHRISADDLAEINSIAEKIAGVKGVQHVYTFTMPYGKAINTSDIETLKSLGGDRYLSEKENKVLIQVVGKYSATDERSKEMVREIRDIVKGEKDSGSIAGEMVGGNTALALDLSNLINDVFWHRIFPVALLLMFLSLIPTLRGLPAVIATMGTIATGVLLSITISSWLFERVFGQQVMWFLPLMVFIVLMGVGIDYNSFYLVKARDEFERRKPEDALIVAAGTMDTLVVGLAAVLTATYGSLMTGATWGIREIGFALALGVLLTATLAVYFIGPATMALFGEKAWWPLHRVEKKE